MTTEKKNKRDVIIAATIELIAEFGFHGTPISMIANKAGVGAGSIYRYFKDKDQLIMEIHELLEVELDQRMRLGYDEERPIRERVLHLCGGLLSYCLEDFQKFMFLEQFYNSPYGNELRRERLLSHGHDCGHSDCFKRALDLGKEQQVIKNLPQVVLSALCIGPIVFIVKDVNAGLLEWSESLMDEVLEACWDALKR